MRTGGRSWKWSIALVTVAPVLVAGCGAHGALAPRGGRATVAEGSSLVVVSRAELARAAGGRSLLAALQAMRATWLAGHPARVSVSVDGAPPTDIAVLGTIAVSEVAEVRFLRGAAGVAARITPDGDTVVGDMILVRTRAQ